MSLKIEVGDLFNAAANTDCIIVHGCNAQGKMGSGFAAIVKKLYPYAYKSYMDAHKKKELKLGVVVYAALVGSKGVVANAITQENYGRDGKLYVDYDAVVDSMQLVRKYALANNLPVHLPMIGGGLGGGDTKRLTAIFQAVFHDVDATLWLKD